MLYEFMKSQVQRVIEECLDTAGQHWVMSKNDKELQQQIQQDIQQLERDYSNTIIDTDDFQTCYQYHAFSQRIMEYIWHPERMCQTEDAFLKSLIEEYRSSRSPNTQTPFLSGDAQIVYGFLKQVMELYWKWAYDKLEVSDRAALGIQMRGLMELKEQLSNSTAGNSSFGSSTVSGKLKTGAFSDRSPSAVIFQRKFHKRLFLEPPDGATLSQVYIVPHCRMNQTWMASASDAVDEFLKNALQNFLIIEGVAGSGKSSFLAALSERYDSSEYIFVSLKDLLKESDTIRFRSALLQECRLSNLETDKVFFLDGFDEISRRIEERSFKTDLQWFTEHGHRLILTTRPGYLDMGNFDMAFSRLTLLLFDEEQIKAWLDAYGAFNPRLLPATCEALLQQPSGQSLREIRQIPIMLYVIANRNINVNTVSCMGELYQQVFDNLKRDKAGMTTEFLERHYLLAQVLAYHMEISNTLQVTVSQASQWAGDLFDKSFFSSVYVENSIIEGTSILEFVHKSILEFFAAKWFYRSFLEEDSLCSILMAGYISDEVLDYLQYFYSCQTDDTQRTFIEHHITESFQEFMQMGLPVEKGRISAETLEEKSSCLFYNFAVLIKQLLKYPTFLTEKVIQENGRNAGIMIRMFLLDGIAKPSFSRHIFSGENLSFVYYPGFMDFSGQDLKKAVFQNQILDYINFWECDLRGAAFLEATIQRCHFDHVNLTGALFDKVTFDKESLSNIRLDNLRLSGIQMPTGYLNIKSAQRSFFEGVRFKDCILKYISFSGSTLNNVHFQNVYINKCNFKQTTMNDVTFVKTTFVNCDFSELSAACGCIFSQCEIDTLTQETNPGLFKAKRMYAKKGRSR